MSAEKLDLTKFWVIIIKPSGTLLPPSPSQQLVGETWGPDAARALNNYRNAQLNEPPEVAAAFAKQFEKLTGVSMDDFNSASSGARTEDL